MGRRIDPGPPGGTDGYRDGLEDGPELEEAGDGDELEHDDDQEHELEPGEPADFRDDQRYAAVGMTGSGKSVWCAYLWSIYPGQRVLLDVNDDYELGPASLADDAGGACVAEQAAAIDWNARTIRVAPRSQGEQTWNDLYAAIWQRSELGHGLCVWLDESYGPTAANRAPRWLRTTITQGRKRRIMHLAAMQEPVNVLPVLYSQAEHLALFELTGRPSDLEGLAKRFRMTADELAIELARLPKFGYLLSSTAAPTPLAMPPLGEPELELVRQHVTMP